MSIIFIPTFILMVQFFFLINHLKYDHSIRKDSSAQIKISFIFLGALYCLRSSHIGNDTETYADLFEKVKFFPFTQLDIFSPRFELGFIYLNKISSLICDNFFFLQIIVGLFVYSITYKFVKEYSPYVGMTIIVFFFVRYHDAYMNIMRQAIATGFTLWSYMYLKKGGHWQFLLLVLLAYTMHQSAIIFLLIWPFTKITYKPKYLKYFIMACLTIFVLGAIITFMISSGILPYYYEDSEYMAGGKIAPAIILFMNVIIFLFFYLNKGYKLKNYKNKQLYGSDITWILMIGILIQITALWFANMERITWYFSIFNIIAIPYALTKIRSSNKVIMSISITAFYIAYYYLILTYRPEWNIVYPYEFFF